MGRTTVLLSKSCQLFFLLIFHVFGKWNSAICVLHYMSQLSGITMRLQINTKPSNSSQNLSPKSFAPRQNSFQNSHPYLASKHSNRLKVYLGMKVQVKSFYKLFFCLWKSRQTLFEIYFQPPKQKYKCQAGASIPFLSPKKTI